MSVKNVMSEIEGLIKNAVMSCASMYGFSAEEALAKIDSNGNLIKAVVDKEQKKAEKQRLMEQKKAEKEQEKAEKQRLVEQKKAEMEQKKAEMEQKKAEKQKKEALETKKQQKEKKDALKETKKQEKEALKAEKEALKEAEKQQKAELASMKEEEILSKAAEKLALKQKKEAEKPRRGKCFGNIKISRIIKSSEDEPFIRFQNIPLIDEINSIRDVKKFKNWKKLSAGVKLARQIMDI